MSLEIQDFRGKTKTQKVLDDVGKIYKENLYKKFPEYFEKQSAKSYSVVTALQNKDEIKNIGMSKLDDLLLNNFGYFIGQLCLTENLTFSKWKAIGGDLNDMAFWQTGNNSRAFNFATFGVITGMIISYGTGSQLPLRSDFKLQTFGQNLTSSNGAYNSGLGKVTMPSTITSTLNTNISETGLNGVWNYDVGTGFHVPKTFLLSRDLISPIVPVAIGQTINIDYEIIIN